MKNIIIYVIALPVLTLIDLVWLGVISKKLYANYLGPIMRSDIVWPAVILFYLFYAFGLLYFVINPAIRADSWMMALGNGTLFGFMAYMTYDLTNWAVLKGFAWQIVPIDIIWGAILSGVVSVIVFFIVKAIY